jgi:ATP-binding cassette, subfamily C (CFTR/MRP), member 1
LRHHDNNFAVITFASGLFGPAIGERQVAWLASTETRVKSTMNMISSFKEVKMLGLSSKYLKNLQALRVKEVELGK